MPVLRTVLLALLSLQLLACAKLQDAIFETGLKAERAMSALNRHELHVAGHHWVYLDSETAGAPVLLMLHGFAVDKDNWLRFARHFKDYRVIAPDLPGHGESSYNPQLTYDFAAQASWLAEFVDALKLTQPVHVLGNSMGGGIALLYSVAHPQRVASITLMDAAGVYPPHLSEFQQIIDNGGRNPLVVESMEDYDALRDFAMVQQPFLPWPAPDVLARRAMARNAINTEIFSDIHAVAEAARQNDDNLRLLEQIQQPVLILWGEQDRVLDVSSVSVFEQHLVYRQSHIFAGVGHAPMLEVPDDSAEVVRTFLQALPPRQALLQPTQTVQNGE